MDVKERLAQLKAAQQENIVTGPRLTGAITMLEEIIAEADSPMTVVID